MSLEQFLSAIVDSEQPLRNAELMTLSGMTTEELESIRSEWEEIDPDRRREALQRLIDIAEDNLDADFDSLFRLCLKDEDPEVRAKAIEGLWECEDRAIVVPLARLMGEDPSDKVRAAAAIALGKFSTLAQLGKILSKDGERIRESLKSVIGNPGETHEVRRRAVEAVAPFNTPEVHQIIREAYGSDHFEMKCSAVYAMGKSCNPQWLSTILQELRSPHPAMRYEASNACGEMGEEEAVPHLIQLFKDDDHQAQASAIAAVGAIGGSLAKRALLSCLKSSDDAVVEAAEEALEVLGETSDI